jgi:RNA 2',3'-cyclic 3'-phosphodiesterase
VDRLTIAYERVWEAFQRSHATADGRHDTPYWREHSGPYAACVVRVPAEALQPRLTDLCRQLANLQGVRLHPDHFLHIMLQELGFVVATPRQLDEISENRLEEFAQSIVEPIATMRAVPVTLGGVNTFQDAVFLEVRGGSPLARLHERLFDLAALPMLPSYSYLPHCTIAHYDGTTPHDEALSLITPWRKVLLGAFTVAEAEIVTLDQREPYPELTTYAVIPFGG